MKLKDLFNQFILETKIWYRVAKDKRTPWISRILLLGAISYLAMPFDIIPDFIPIIGQLDDLIIIPVMVWLAWKFVPKEIIEEHRKAVIEATNIKNETK